MMPDEFRFLRSDAGRVQRLAPLPTMRRITRHAPSARAVSAIVTRDLLARDDAVVVFLHGAGLNAHTFDQTILALGENTISIDLPGHGRSDWRPDATYTPETMAPDVAFMIESLTSDGVHLVGQSLGGLTAAALIPMLNNRIHTLTLIDVTPGISPDKEAGAVAEFITGKRDFASVDEMVDRAIDFGIGSDREVLRRGVELNARERSDGRFEWSHHFAHLDGFGAGAHTTAEEQPYAALWDPLGSLGSRVALVRGTHGLVTNHMQSEWRNRLTRSEIFTVEGGHNLHEHAPKELAQTLRDIFRQ